MRFLLDNGLSPRMVKGLHAAGHDVVHVRDLGFSRADDEVIFDNAAKADRILVSLDTDFGTITATRSSLRPSVLLFRCRQKSTDALLALILKNLPQIEQDLEAGALVVIEDTRIRSRRLPISGHQ